VRKLNYESRRKRDMPGVVLMATAQALAGIHPRLQSVGVLNTAIEVPPPNREGRMEVRIISVFILLLLLLYLCIYLFIAIFSIVSC